MRFINKTKNEIHFNNYITLLIYVNNLKNYSKFYFLNKKIKS